MSDNNTMYRMFRQMIQGYKLGKEGENLFVHAVHCWMDLNPDNPFSEDSAAYDYFFRMKNYYNVWKLRSADQRISERRLINEAREMCATKPKNPYKYDKKAADEEKVLLRESAKKEQEEAINIQKEADREKAEREAEIREILEEIRQDDLEHQSELLGNRAIVEEVKAEVRKQEADKQKEIKKPEKNYVFNVQENANDIKVFNDNEDFDIDKDFNTDEDFDVDEDFDIDEDFYDQKEVDAQKKKEKKSWLRRFFRR